MKNIKFIAKIQTIDWNSIYCEYILVGKTGVRIRWNVSVSIGIWKETKIFVDLHSALLIHLVSDVSSVRVTMKCSLCFWTIRRFHWKFDTQRNIQDKSVNLNEPRICTSNKRAPNSSPALIQLAAKQCKIN